MPRKLSLLLLILLFLFGCAAKSEKNFTGKITQFENLTSQYVDARNISVWLPPGYDNETERRYPVIYMQDGQNLFDSTTAYIGVEWGIDETMSRLLREKKIEPAIIVGIWNTPKRRVEYMPQKAFERYLSEKQQRDFINQYTTVAPLGDAYLKFMTLELKPFIDSIFRTKREAAHTFVMGSSMGGLISLYAVCEYPNIFSGAACVSTHWPAADGITLKYLPENLPEPKTHKFYFDFGTETLDAEYEAYQVIADSIFPEQGYVAGAQVVTRKFPGHEHSEKSWQERAGIPIQFLLNKTQD